MRRHPRLLATLALLLVALIVAAAVAAVQQSPAPSRHASAPVRHSRSPTVHVPRLLQIRPHLATPRHKTYGPATASPRTIRAYLRTPMAWMDGAGLPVRPRTITHGTARFHGHIFADAPGTNSTLAAPASITTEPDDRVNKLGWGNNQTAVVNPTGVAGYRVLWGPAGSPLTNTILTTGRLVDLQPLTNGASYQAEVQDVDYSGNVGPLTAPIAITATSARVDALRTQMTGFFDDFNRPKGTFDETKWNTAVSFCAHGPLSQTQINTQFHAHNQVADVSAPFQVEPTTPMTGGNPLMPNQHFNCDRGQVVARPRNSIDLSGGATRTLAFDMDGMGRRDIWYLDLMPRLMDITGQTNLEGQPGLATPASFLRFKMSNANYFEIDWFNAQSQESNLASAETRWIPGSGFLYNVRQHFVIHVSQTHVDMSVNGTQFMSATLPTTLPYTTAYPIFVGFSYNTPKSNEQSGFLHWDNFGFDGPASTVLTHNYQDAGYTGDLDDRWVKSTGDVTVPITIPDSLAGATAARVMLTEQSPDYGPYTPNAADTVTVNGTAYSIANATTLPWDPVQPTPPVTPALSFTYVDLYHPTGIVTPISVTTLRTGVNNLVFHAGGQYPIEEVHIEVDFPITLGNAIPSYTPPAVPTPMAMDYTAELGPGAAIGHIAGQQMLNTGVFWENNTAIQPEVYNGACNCSSPISISGTVPVAAGASQDILLAATGKNFGIGKVQLYIDGALVQSLDTTGGGLGAPVPSWNGTFQFDTTPYTNGIHYLDFRAFSPSGVLSTPDYFQAETGGLSGIMPMPVNIQNPVSGAGVPTPTPVPTNTPLPTPPSGLQYVDDTDPAWTYTIAPDGFGAWSHCNACNTTSYGLYANSESYDNNPADTATLVFTGTQIALTALVGPAQGMIGVAIDGGPQQYADEYATALAGDTPVYTSTVLSAGQHTLVVSVSGQQNYASASDQITLDRAIVATSGTLGAPSTPVALPTSPPPTATPLPPTATPTRPATPVAGAPTPTPTFVPSLNGTVQITGARFRAISGLLQSHNASVDVVGLSRAPGATTVVTWSNLDAMTCTVTMNDGSGATPAIPSGGSEAFTFHRTGTFFYHCAEMPSMVGAIVVARAG